MSPPAVKNRWRGYFASELSVHHFLGHPNSIAEWRQDWYPGFIHIDCGKPWWSESDVVTWRTKS